MNDKLIQSQKLLQDSLFELYMQGGLELYLAGTRGLKRELIIELETSALTPEKGRSFTTMQSIVGMTRTSLRSLLSLHDR